MKRTGPTNYTWRRTIRLLRKVARENNAKIWKYIAELLEKPRRKRVVVNISKINRYSMDGDTVIVPGKVLGAGNINHKVTIVAMAFSKQAIDKIKAAEGRALHILEFLNENPKGSKVKVIV
jgi:large subunit ribosomal protein L18e